MPRFKLDPKKPAKSDWRAFDAMTEEERHSAALADTDAPPATEAQLARARRVPTVSALREMLNLTPDQKAKVQPIIDQAKPQMKAIHQEAMQKAKAVMDSTMAQIRPLLSADQQKKLDDMKAAHEQMRDAAKKLHDAQKE